MGDFASLANVVPPLGQLDAPLSRRCHRAVDELRQRDAGDLEVIGSSGLVRSLISHNLVDEYRPMIEPIILGGEKRIFPDHGTARPFELVSVVTNGTGGLICTLKPAHRSPTPAITMFHSFVGCTAGVEVAGGAVSERSEVRALMRLPL
jgi:hypothetical protein